MKKIVPLILIIFGAAAYYHYKYARRQAGPKGETEYVLPDHLPVVDTTAEVRRVITTLHAGEPVLVTGHYQDWAKVALGGGEEGWVRQNALLSGEVYHRARQLLEKAEKDPVQATGHLITVANVHLDPSRAAMTVAQFPPNQSVDIYNRRVTRRVTPSGAQGRDIWYLVQGGYEAGWILGDFVSLDIPPGLASYAQGTNIVAWKVLDTVNAGGRPVPQYLAASRNGVEMPDFNCICVYTYWIKRHEYVVAYVESGLTGYFPITVTHLGGVPYFRLRLINGQGQEIQKVYGLFDTIVRPMGLVSGWTSTAMPARQKKKSR